jgi:hypothetical protein
MGGCSQARVPCRVENSVVLMKVPLAGASGATVAKAKRLKLLRWSESSASVWPIAVRRVSAGTLPPRESKVASPGAAAVESVPCDQRIGSVDELLDVGIAVPVGVT